MQRRCDSHPRSARNPKLCQELRRYPPTLTDATDAETQHFQRSPAPTDARKWLPKHRSGSFSAQFVAQSVRTSPAYAATHLPVKQSEETDACRPTSCDSAAQASCRQGSRGDSRVARCLSGSPLSKAPNPENIPARAGPDFLKPSACRSAQRVARPQRISTSTSSISGQAPQLLREILHQHQVRPCGLAGAP